MRESFAASFILRPPQIESINSDGSNRRTILTAKDRINRPTAMAIMDRFAILSFFSFFIPFSFRRLYYLDPQYEKVVRVDLPNGDNPKTLLDNEVKLRTLNIYRKRPLRSNHPCLTNQGGCDHICIPAADNQRTCGCSVGFQKRANDDTSCLPYSSYAIVSQLSLARGFSLKDQGEAMMPISGKGGTDLLYPFYILRD